MEGPTMNDYEKRVQECYSTWGATYYEDYYGAGAPYPPVHREILRGLLHAHEVHSLLDAGCGPASFLRDLKELGPDRYGFDLTPGMIEEGRRIFAEQGLPPQNLWLGSVLDAAAYAPPARRDMKFDAAVCVGVLPHINEADEERVIAGLRSAVKPGGLVALEARNQFFALYTLNRYSYDFFSQELLRGGELCDRAKQDRLSVEQVLEDMKSHFRLDLPPVRKGKDGEPGYDEVLSRAHNPLVLQRKFASGGFAGVKVLFYHYHCLPPMFGPRAPEFFRRESLAMENPEDWRGYFMASAFILCGIAA